MAAESSSLSEEQVLCLICLEVFTDPVTTACGHSFCRICISRYWDSSHQYNCPVCEQDFRSRPEIKVNTVLAARVFELHDETQDEETFSSKTQSASPGEVACVSASPGEEVCVSPAPGVEGCVSPAPVELEVACVSASPGEEVCVFPAPGVEGCVSPAPVELEVACVSASPGEEVCVSPAPGVEGCVSPAPVELEVVCDVTAAAVEVDCDLCPEPRLRAVKSCLVCLASYCQNHLQPHLTNPRLKRHHLIQPLPNLEERICPEHDRPLELFCREHSHFICLHCTSEAHKEHQAVPLKEEGEMQQATLKEEIRERLLKIKAIQCSVEQSQRNADTEIQEGLRVFNALMECVQQSLNKFKEDIVEKHKKNEEEAAQLIEQIQTEISVLEQRGAEMEQLWSSGDHLQFVQTFTSVKPAPQLNNWTEKEICSTYGGMLAKNIPKLKEGIDEQITKVFKDDFKRFQKYAVSVTLDDETAHQNIRVECYSKKAQYTQTKQDYPNNYDRFSVEHFVLGQETFSSGRFYFEVSVKGSRQWAVGVVKSSVRRRGNIDVGPYRGFYLIEWDNEDSWPCKVGGTRVYLECMPRVIGVFVDYEEGVVSFFDVNKGVLISSITHCSFTGDLLPLVSPGDRRGAMQITAV